MHPWRTISKIEFGVVMNEAGFKGKTAIVTGSATGIGAAVALRLGREGANIVVNFAKSEADFQHLYAVNVIGAFQMVRAVIAPLKECGQGTAVNISSIAGILGIGSSIAYAASKGALNTMTRSRARALAPHVRVNIADVVAFFAGPGSRHVTGETLLTDGGLHLTAGQTDFR